eukprot:820572-Rhodomonas_salina.1
MDLLGYVGFDAGIGVDDDGQQKTARATRTVSLVKECRTRTTVVMKTPQHTGNWWIARCLDAGIGDTLISM